MMDDFASVQITSDDLQVLMQRNPLAAEQLKNISLARVMGKQAEELKKLQDEAAKLNGKKSDSVLAKEQVSAT
jgi:hypothetical protein